MTASKIFFDIYMTCFLITIYSCGRWTLIALRWHIREYGLQKVLFGLHNPIQLWRNIFRIWREVPGSKSVFARAGICLCVLAIIHYIRFHAF